MPREFYRRLQSYFGDVGRVLKGEADSASIFPNTTDVGMSREQVYLQVLKMHLPSNCNAFYGGFVFDIVGAESKQIDLIVSDGKALQFNFHNRDGSGKSFACIEGCIAVASIKSTMNTRELRDSLENIASLPDKRSPATNPLFRYQFHDEWPFKIIYASDGIACDSLQESLRQFYQENPSIPMHKRPNLIHVAGKYSGIRIYKPQSTRDGTVIPLNTFHFQTSHVDEFAIPYTIIEIQKIATVAAQTIFNYDEIIDRLPFD